MPTMFVHNKSRFQIFVSSDGDTSTSSRSNHDEKSDSRDSTEPQVNASDAERLIMTPGHDSSLSSLHEYSSDTEFIGVRSPADHCPKLALCSGNVPKSLESPSDHTSSLSSLDEDSNGSPTSFKQCPTAQPTHVERDAVRRRGRPPRSSVIASNMRSLRGRPRKVDRLDQSTSGSLFRRRGSDRKDYQRPDGSMPRAVLPDYSSEDLSTDDESRDDVGDCTSRWSLLRASLNAPLNQNSSISRRKQNLVGLRPNPSVVYHSCDSDALKELHDLDRKSASSNSREMDIRSMSERYPCATNHQSYVSCFVLLPNAPLLFPSSFAPV
ncbi:hypothetical protein FBUS_11026 [Fasciolopsis buskii]|uniref:Uncharacterized protein n=1 Tax=Fasciolopsis buskii TaxID=27845 RepID=A0A8E0S2D2_9TREM|nr:hypothetical protein FBUS_11026 [Fasciolopsis buski]